MICTLVVGVNMRASWSDGFYSNGGKDSFDTAMCGAGGNVRDGVIEIQDDRNLLLEGCENVAGRSSVSVVNCSGEEYDEWTTT
jgi:hypothetical protein